MVTEARKREQLSKSALAERAGIPRSVVSMFETGKNGLRLEAAVRIAQVLDIRLDDLK
jgi:transcriptional regulator with XRE-family HTH domain